jgi:hypothetical protein
MKTAVEYIKEKLMCDEYWYENMTFDQIFEQAKEMEKEQMIDFACDVYDLNYCKDKSFRNAAEQYYNETFKQQEQ